MSAKAIPDRCTSVTPHLIVKKSGAEAIEFYKRAFGAEEIYRLPGPGGSIMHAEIRIGSAVIFLCELGPGMDVAWAAGAQWPAITLHHYVEDARAAFQRAVDAGCTVNMPLADMFWGDRYGKVTDPYGHVWAIAQHLEDLTPEQMSHRAADAFAQMKT